MVFKSNKESRKESLRARWDCTRRERANRRMRNESPLEGFLKNTVVSDCEPKMDTGSPSRGSSLW